MAPPAGMEGQQVVQEGQQVLHGGLLEDGQQLVFIAPEGAEGQQVAGPARVNVSPELFAKLAAGGQLTPEEM